MINVDNCSQFERDWKRLLEHRILRKERKKKKKKKKKSNTLERCWIRYITSIEKRKHHSR